MYAAIVHLTIDPEEASQAAATFGARILPQVAAAEGLVNAFWVDPEAGDGFGFLVFETEAQARSAVPPTVSWDAPGTTIKTIQFRRVAVSIP